MQRRRKTAGAQKMKNATTRRDATLREFEQKDLGDGIASEGAAVVVRPQRPTSILLSDELKEALRKMGIDFRETSRIRSAGALCVVRGRRVFIVNRFLECSTLPFNREGVKIECLFDHSPRGDSQKGVIIRQ